MYKEFLEIFGNESPTGSVLEETTAASATISISVAEKSGTLQNASSTRPRAVADLGKSARMHTVSLMNNRVKGPRRMMTRVQLLC